MKVGNIGVKDCTKFFSLNSLPQNIIHQFLLNMSNYK